MPKGSPLDKCADRRAKSYYDNDGPDLPPFHQPPDSGAFFCLSADFAPLGIEKSPSPNGLFPHFRPSLLCCTFFTRYHIFLFHPLFAAPSGSFRWGSSFLGSAPLPSRLPKTTAHVKWSKGACPGARLPCQGNEVSMEMISGNSPTVAFSFPERSRALSFSVPSKTICSNQVPRPGLQQRDTIPCRLAMVVSRGAGSEIPLGRSREGRTQDFGLARSKVLR